MQTIRSNVLHTFKTKPSLIPLAATVGLTCAGYAALVLHSIAYPDVTNVPQDKNIKALTFNPEFWKAREGMPSPEAAFMDGQTAQEINEAKRAQIQAIKRRVAERRRALAKDD